MTQVVIIDYGLKELEELDFDKNKVVEKRKRKIKLENGTEVRLLQPDESALRGRKPDVVILRCEVSQKFYHKIIKPMVGYHGVIIDESGK